MSKYYAGERNASPDAGGCGYLGNLSPWAIWDRSGDRLRVVADARSEEDARLIAGALNATENRPMSAAELVARYRAAQETYAAAVESGQGMERADDEMTTTAREVGAEAVELLERLLPQLERARTVLDTYGGEDPPDDVMPEHALAPALREVLDALDGQEGEPAAESADPLTFTLSLDLTGARYDDIPAALRAEADEWEAANGGSDVTIYSNADGDATGGLAGRWTITGVQR